MLVDRDESSAVTTHQTRLKVSTGLHLHVSQWGASNTPPVLILHGGGHDASCWAAVCLELADAYRCVVPDARGHGQSDWSASGDYSCESQVADLLSLLDLLDIKRCAMVGHSMGGLNALQLAGSHPNRVTGLVLVDVGTETRKSGLKRVRANRARTTPAKNPYPVTPAKSDPRLRDHVPTYCGDAAYRRELVRAAAAPLLVMRGERSAILSRQSAEATAQLFAGTVREIPGAAHNVSLANPTATALALREFLDGLCQHQANVIKYAVNPD